eukprot:TRINITY_DN12274_c0_g1_i1.p1 TRINITY_DN12274_c0_g1~~TRINITY_DN12274_c0_g1_i1.p1  ORF type:complete len:282 (+),score=78.38 TRINITY_DN12274_c0_g1_i1:71-916(+)
MALKNPGLYTDLGKKASDLLNKEFPDRKRLEIKTRTSNGVTFEANVTQNPDDSIVGDFKPKYNYGRQGIAFGASVDTHRNVKLDVSIAPVPETKVTVTGDATHDTITVEAEWRNPNATLNTAIDFFNPKGTNASLAAVGAYQNMSVGVQTRYSNNLFTAVNGVAAYSGLDYTATLYGQFKANKLGATFYQRINARTAVGADMSISTAEKSADSARLAVGGSYDLDPVTTVKAKFDTEGRLAASYAQRLSVNARAIVGGSVNTNNLTRTGNHTFGFTLQLND